MNHYEKTLEAHATISGKTGDEFLQTVHDLCDIATAFTLEGRSAMGKVVRVVDGDSMRVSIPVDGHVWTFPVVLEGVDCPEIRTKNRREKDLGLDAKRRVEEMVLGKVVGVKLGEFDKFGRLLASLTTREGINVSEELVSLGLAVPYDGRGKRPAWGSRTASTST